MDVWGFAENGDTVFAVVIKVREGILADKQNFSFEGSSLSEVKNELLFRYYSQTREFPKAVLVDEETEDLDLLSEFLSHCANGKLSAVIPKRGGAEKAFGDGQKQRGGTAFLESEPHGKRGRGIRGAF